jgi:hypothetical protein
MSARVNRIGAWSMRAGLTDHRPWAKVAAGLGLTDVSLSAAEQSRGRFEPFLSPAKAAAALRVYADAGIRCHLMLWPVPDLQHVQQSLDYIAAVRAAFPALASVDLDAEEQWTQHPRRAALGAAAAGLYRRGWPAGLPLAVNGITAALPRIADLVAVADVLWPQAYTTTRPNQTMPPGNRQHDVYKAWRSAAPASATVQMGLAAYSQDGAGGLPAAEALRRAYDAAAEHVTEIRYWSLQELSGGTDAAFVRARCAELRGARPSA